MKFLSKYPDSRILKDNMKYSTNAQQNRKLKDALIEEQKGFCAYSEKFIEDLDSVDIEHFNSSLKYTAEDDYYNYYAVLHKINSEKKDEKYKDAKFHNSLFFQNKAELDSRIKISNLLYFAIREEDTEAIDLIDFLMLNSNSLYEARKKHIAFLKSMRHILTEQEFTNLFKNHKQNLSFISIIESEFDLSFDHLL